MRKLLLLNLLAVLAMLCSVAPALAIIGPCSDCSCDVACSALCETENEEWSTCGEAGVCSSSPTCQGDPCLTTGDLKAFLASAGGPVRWPAGEVAIRSMDASHVEVSFDRTADGTSERRLVLTTVSPVGAFSASGRAKVVIAGEQLLVVATGGKALTRTAHVEGGVAEDRPNTLQIGFTHLAEYRGSTGHARLGEPQAADLSLTGIPYPNPYPGGSCASACSVTCRSPESTCSVNCSALGNLCAVCECLPNTGASCGCQEPPPE